MHATSDSAVTVHETTYIFASLTLLITRGRTLYRLMVTVYCLVIFSSVTVCASSRGKHFHRPAPAQTDIGRTGWSCEYYSGCKPMTGSVTSGGTNQKKKGLRHVFRGHQPVVVWKPPWCSFTITVFRLRHSKLWTASLLSKVAMVRCVAVSIRQ